MTDRRAFTPVVVGASPLTKSSALYRAMGNDRVMVSPPTITVDQLVAAGAWPAAALTTRDNSGLRHEGVIPFRTASNYYLGSAVQSSDGAVIQYDVVPMRTPFDFEGQAFDIVVNPQGALPGVRVWVDGEAAALAPSMFTTGASDRVVTVDFGSRGYRRIVLETNCYFKGLRIGPTDAVHPSSAPLGPLVAVVGDSYSIGQQATHPCHGYVPRLARKLGLPGLFSVGLGGTGYHAGTTPNVYYGSAGRLNWLTTQTPDAIVLQGSLNDGASAADPYPANVLATAQAYRAAFPQLPILMTGPLFAAVSTNYWAQQPAIQAAAVAIDATFADTSGWFAGTGRVGATTGAGNADLDRNTDGTHPTDAGYGVLAGRLAPIVSAWLGQVVS